MTILFIDSSKKDARVALLSSETVLAERAFLSQKTMANDILVALDEMVAESGIAKEDIGRIAVVRGPGHFSAVRSGVAVAHSLALGWGVELIGIPSSEVLDEYREAREGMPVDVVLPKYEV